ncbi:uncharacterized protein LOC119549364 [Drosophila subpulchrella]|uniref:uncharacterized protein LOC119549364 n=1 Tax=Drosophila subpulchrella TaxID=1486046 RepID=UPI0018A1A573|nr:uncharacterized protein LOC119549364 [Drosophila subpulchrella]
MSTTDVSPLSSELPSCAAGFTWVILMNTCLPDLARTRRKKCAYGYYYHERFQKCMRRRYDKGQQPGVIRRWMTQTPKPMRTTRKYGLHNASPYTGGWWGYNAGYGKDQPYPNPRKK